MPEQTKRPMTMTKHVVVTRVGDLVAGDVIAMVRTSSHGTDYLATWKLTRWEQPSAIAEGAQPQPTIGGGIAPQPEQPDEPGLALYGNPALSVFAKINRTARDIDDDSKFSPHEELVVAGLDLASLILRMPRAGER